MYYRWVLARGATAVRSTLANEWTYKIRFAPTRDCLDGAPDRIRTCDPWLRKPILYPTELRARHADFSSTVQVSSPSAGVQAVYFPVWPMRTSQAAPASNKSLRS